MTIYSRTIRYALLAVLLSAIAFPMPAIGEVMSSGSYSIESDTVNFGGTRSTSTNYGIEDTGGEIATGDLNGSTYDADAGYQQADVVAADAGDSSQTASSVLNSSGGRIHTYYVEQIPINVFGFTASPRTDGILLSWVNPAGGIVSGVTIVRSTLFYPASTTDGDVIFDGGALGDLPQVMDYDVESGKMYYYTLFAKNLSGEYSSGVVAHAVMPFAGQLVVPPGVPEIFERVPVKSGVHEDIKSLEFPEFEFIQDGRLLANVGNSFITDGTKNLTIRLAYDRVPEILKTIAIAIAQPDDPSKVFTFLLRANKDRTYYEATIGPLGKSGVYSMQAIVIDFDNQGLKKISGNLRVLTLSAVETNAQIEKSASSPNIYIYALIAILIILLILLVLILHKRKEHASSEMGGGNVTFIFALIAGATIVLGAIGGVALVARAAFNEQINYQGKLFNAAGDAVADGTYAMEFALYTQASGGAAIWTETRSGANEVQVTDGLFSVLLGEVSSISAVDFDQTLYLGVNIEGDGEMTPRKKIGAVPAAFMSNNSLALNGLASSQFLRSDATNATAIFTTASTTYFEISGRLLDSTGSAGSNGQVLKVSGGAPVWSTDNTGGGGSELNWTFFNNSGIYVSTTTNQVLIGDIATTTSQKLEVIGGGYFSGNLGLGTTSPWARLSVQGVSDLGNYARAGYFVATTTTASQFPYASSTAISVSGTASTTDMIVSDELTLGVLNGPLQANNGTVSATTSVGVLYGGTGLTTAPSYGQLLIGNSSGGYSLGATSTLGLVTSVGASGGTTGLTFSGSPITTSGTLTLAGTLAAANGGTGWGNILSGALLYGNGTSALATTSAGSAGQVLALLNGIPTWTSTTTFGTGLTYANGSVTNAGVLSVAQTYGSAQTGAITLATSSQTTNGQTVGLNITNTSGAFTLAPTISGTLAAGGGGTGISNPTAAGVLLGSYAGGDWQQVATSSLNIDTDDLVQGATNLFYSDTLVNSYIHSSTTIPKVYTANTYTGAQTFSGGVTIGSLNGPLQANNGTVSATTSVGVLYGGTGATSFSYGLLLGNGTSAITNIATSSLNLLTTHVTEGSNLYYTTDRFDARLAATTTLPNLTTLLGLTDTITTRATTTGATTTALYIGGTIRGGGLSSCSGSSDKLIWNATTNLFGCGADAGAGGGITALNAQYSSAQTGSSQTFATSSDTNILFTITSAADVHTFTPSWTGTLAATRGGTGISNPTAAGVLLGSYAGGGWQQVATSSLNIDTDNLVQGATNLFYSDTLVNSYIHSSTTIPKVYTANTYTGAQTFSGGVTIGSLNGPLQANNGTVSATTSVGVLYGGTGLTTAPTYGQLLIGNSSGGYSLGATSTLGIAISDTTGTLPVTRGGTGASSFSYGLLLGDGTSAITNIATSSLNLLTTHVTEGSNLYYTTDRFGATMAGTTTDALDEGSTNLYWSNDRFDARLAATTTLPNLTTLLGLTDTITTRATTTGATTTALYIGGTIRGGGLSSCSGSSDKLIWNATTNLFGCGADAGAGGGITALNAQYSSAQTGSSQTFATSSDTNILFTITSAADVHTFTPSWTGTLAATRGGTGISNPTAAGVLLGSYAGGGWQQVATSSLNIDTDDLVQGATNLFYSDTLVNSYIHSSTTIPKVYTANTYTGAQTFSGGVTIGSLNGPLQANNGTVSATTSVGVLYGGTGLTTAPTYGQLLIGNSSGGYSLGATSTLGLVTSVGASGGTTGLTFSGSPITTSGTLTLAGTLAAANGGTGWGNILSGALLYGNGTSALATTSAGTAGQVLALLNGIPTWTSTTTFGSGLTYSNGSVTNAGVLSVAQTYGSAQTGAITLATSSQTTNGQTVGLNITNTSGAFTLAPTISGTLAAGGGGTGISNPTAAGVLLGSYAGGGWQQIATSSLNIDTDNLVQGATNLFYSDTLVNSYIHSSTTIPKVYTANTYTGAQTFSGGVTIGSLNGPLQANNGTVSATTSVGVLYGGTGLTTAPTYGQLLIGNSSGGYSLGATSTLGIGILDTTGTLTVARGGTGATTFGQGWIYSDGGTDALAASTSPTVNYIIATSTTATSTFGWGISANLLDVRSTTASSTFANGINLTGGCFSINGSCVGGGSASLSGGAANKLAFWTAADTLSNNTYFHWDNTNRRLGIGTTTPGGALSIEAFSSNTAPIFIVATSTASATSTAFVIDPNGKVGIGTTSPFAQLSVAGHIAGTQLTIFSTTSTTTLSGGLNVNSGLLAHDWYTGVTSISSLETGNLNFETDAGVVSWVDLPISSAAAGTVEAYRAQIGSVPVLSVYGESNGSGASTNRRVGIGTTTPWGTLSVAGSTTLATSNAFVVSDVASTTRFVIQDAGNVGVGTTSPWRTFSVTGTAAMSGLTAITGTPSYLCLSAEGEVMVGNTSNCTPSSIRYKHDVEDLDIGLAELLRVRPVTFTFNEGEQTERVGFIAEEVAEIDPRLVVYDASSTPASVRYDEFSSVLTRSIQQLSSILDITSNPASAGAELISNRLVSIESRLTALENGSTSPTFISKVADSVIEKFAQFGLTIRDNVFAFTSLIADTLTSKKVTTETLCIEDVCVSRDQFLALVSTVASTTSQSGGDTSNSSDTPNTQNTGNTQNQPNSNQNATTTINIVVNTGGQASTTATTTVLVADTTTSSATTTATTTITNETITATTTAVTNETNSATTTVTTTTTNSTGATGETGATDTSASTDGATVSGETTPSETVATDTATDTGTDTTTDATSSGDTGGDTSGTAADTSSSDVSSPTNPFEPTASI